ncbi:MAG: hypothetical protein ACFB10_11840 [Salibacteraceae bacterium]
MRAIHNFIAVLCFALLVSCSGSYHLIGEQEVQQAFILHSSPTFKGYYYHGCDAEFHYFTSRWKWKKDERFKLKKETLKVRETVDLGKTTVPLTLMKTSLKFGSNSYVQLYVVE